METQPTGYTTTKNTDLHVKFQHKEEIVERKKKYLTAKYGQHQMALIRKRLAVETWLFDNLQDLYTNEAAQDSSSGEDIDIDLDNLLDLDTDSERRQFVENLLVGCPKSKDVVNNFIENLLTKAKTL